ncbi:MAG TPA: helix-turn-helix transcriptional regulator [Candidatus Limnocylindrales bacterium]|nr:helix-turn-helix transcriptional regulator [Candidatus Limnocylindrales bacterium]
MDAGGLGTALRLAREAARISLAGMAKRAGYSKSHLGNVENGKRAATPDVVLAYERELGHSVQRRGVISGLAAGFVAPIVVSELIHTGFNAALGRHPSVAEWEERVAGYGHDYMSAGAGEIRDRLAGDLVVMQQNLESPRMWALAARALTMLGKVSSKSSEAISWYRLAGTVADRSQDERTRVWVRGRGALALAYEGAQLNVAEELADHALALSDKPTLGRLNALLGRAHAFGLRGRRREAFRVFSEARRVFDVVDANASNGSDGSDGSDGSNGSNEQISDFAIPPWRMGVISSLLLARLGEERLAVAAQDDARRTLPKSLPRFATHLELHQALMLVRSGDRETGVTVARAAMAKLPRAKYSQSLRLMLAEIER